MPATHEELGEFFDRIWKDTPGWVYLPRRDPNNPDPKTSWKKKMFKWPEGKSDAIQYTLANSAEGYDSFFAPAIFKEPNPVKKYVLGSWVLWTEFDGNAPEEWHPKNLNDPHKAAGAGDEGLHGVPEPTIRVQSSKDGHEHCYWQLEEFNADVTWIEGSNRSIAYTLRSDTSGWDINQILRPPGTTNYKHGLPVTVARVQDEVRYHSTDFRTLKPALRLVDESINVDNLPGVESLIAKYPWDTTHYELLQAPEVITGDGKGRSFAMMRLAYFGAETGMEDTEIYSLLTFVDDKWGKYVGRADRHQRLLDFIDRARQKHPAGNTLSFAGLLGPTDPKEIIGEKVTYTYSEFLNSEIKVEWLIEGMLERGGVGLIASSPGVGKTQVSIQLALSAATGKRFLLWSIPQPLKVVLFSLEMGRVGLKSFMTTIHKGVQPQDVGLLDKNLTIVPLGGFLSMDRPEGIRLMHAILDPIQPDLIIIDSVGRLSAKTLDEETAKKLNDEYINLREKYGCGIWLIHHNRKASADNKKPTELDDIYGNQYITAEVSAAFILWRNRKRTEDKNKIEFITPKLRFAQEPDPFHIIRDPNTLHFSLEEGDLANLAKDTETTDSNANHFDLE